MSTVKIAVTGGAGSGKTCVCKRFEELGLKVVSSDVLARDVVVPGSAAYGEIVRYFGERVLKKDGNLNRRLLRRIIVQDAAARKSLESFIHPEIIKRIGFEVAAAEKEGLSAVVVEVPLLFELGMQDEFDHVVVVSTDSETRIRRLMNRDHISREEAQALLDVQMPDEEKTKRTNFVIRNNGSLGAMIRSVDRFYEKLCKKT